MVRIPLGADETASLNFPLILASYDEKEPNNLYLGICQGRCHFHREALSRKDKEPPLDYQIVLDCNIICLYMEVAKPLKKKWAKHGGRNK